MYYVDTSVLMPYTLTRKMEPERHQKAEQLFALADTGKLSLATSLYALVELYAVVLGKISNLHAASEVTKKAITSIFRRKISLLPLPNRLDKSMYSRKLSVLQDTADLSHTVSAIVNGCQGIITYDTHFLVIKDVIPTHSPDDVIAEIRRSTPVSSVPITKPFFDDAEKEAVIKPLETGWVVQGPNVAEFERIFAEYTGAKYAKATTSCTTALHLALIACGISEGDEVIVPAFTYVASANAVEYQKAKPVFVDIDIKTFNLDVEQLEQKITDKTKAIMPVHLFGLCADMEPILQIAEQYNLAVIEDAACAVGSLYKGKHAGTFGNAGCFSFHPRKPITTGEGGMLTTADADLASLIDALRSHGATVSDVERHKKGAFALPEHNIVGYNYRMTDLQGAIGIQQMNKLDWILNRRIELAHIYDKALEEINGINTPFVPEGYKHTYQSYVILVEDTCPLSRDELALKLQSKGIATRQGTHAVHALGYY